MIVDCGLANRGRWVRVGVADRPRCSGGRRVPRSGRGGADSGGWLAWGSGAMQGLEAGEGVGDGLGLFPAGRDLQDRLAGVHDISAGCAE
jgi:hypothetical protein